MSELEFAELEWSGRPLRIEYRWVGGDRPTQPLIVFLHERLGSVSMWKDFPSLLCEAVGVRGLVYSRPGYGRSTPRPADERWDVDFMHRQAYEVLPVLLTALGVEGPSWFLGHSDGGSIALLFASRFQRSVAGLIVLAPHILVEEYGLVSIRKVREAYLRTDLKERLSRYHDDVDSAFWGWNDIWLDPAFKDWTITAELQLVQCPVLAIQGLDDEYGTLEQIHGIARRVPGAELRMFERCGHAAHRDRRTDVIDECVRFIAEQRR